jgi:hypothetical protein
MKSNSRPVRIGPVMWEEFLYHKEFLEKKKKRKVSQMEVFDAMGFKLKIFRTNPSLKKKQRLPWEDDGWIV